MRVPWAVCVQDAKVLDPDVAPRGVVAGEFRIGSDWIQPVSHVHPSCNTPGNGERAELLQDVLHFIETERRSCGSMTSEVSVTVTVDDKHDTDELEKRLHAIAEGVELIDNQCILAIVGQHVMSDARVGARVLEALQSMPVKMISLGRSGLNLSIVVDDSRADEAVKAIHHTLFEAAVPV